MLMALAATLVPGTVMHAWWLVSVPLAAGAVLAAVVHFKRRHGLRLRRHWRRDQRSGGAWHR